MLPLRDYQQRAITLLYAWLSCHSGNPCIVAPTGSGKSHIIAGLCRDVLNRWPQSKILILSHVKELLEQDAEKIRLAWGDSAPLGIYSAGLGHKDCGCAITVAGIQSVRNRADLIGFVDLVIVDEAHLISHKAEGGYRTLLNALLLRNPNLRIVGLTATPYRLGHGLISENGALFDGIIEPVKIEELVARGFLAPLRSKLPNTVLDVHGVKKHGGEFVASELQAAVDTDRDNVFIVEETIRRAEDRKAWLFFCTGVAHAKRIRDVLVDHGIVAETVTGATPKEERARILAEFRAGNIRALTNAEVLTTGFDYPDIDLIAMCRPTMSPGLYVQMLGRGMRVKSHTDHCLVLDFAGNVRTHGPIISVEAPRYKGSGGGDAPVKVCDVCSELVHLSLRVCPCCGYEFPPAPKEAVILHDDDDVMGIEACEMNIISWRWSVQVSKAKGIAMLRVDYISAELAQDAVCEFITILHDGYARHRAYSMLRYFIDMSGADLILSEAPLDESYLNVIAEAMNSARHPKQITYRKEGRYCQVQEHIWDGYPDRA